MGFRENLKAELEYQNIKTQELADKSGVNKRTIDHYLMTNPQEPSVTNAFKIAQALDVSVEYLLTGKETKNKTFLSREDIEIFHLFSQLSTNQKNALKNLLNSFTTSTQSKKS